MNSIARTPVFRIAVGAVLISWNGLSWLLSAAERLQLEVAVLRCDLQLSILKSGDLDPQNS